MNMVHTTIETKDSWTRMVYHNTCVAEYHPQSTYCQKELAMRAACRGVDYDIRLNTGGYFTKTTKKRMNQFAEMFDLPFRVYQQSGQWYVIDHAPNGKGDIAQFSGNTCSFTINK